ncbi:MAG: hypothetical protein R6V28_05460 [Nitriliruptoraceae bacterium]
MIIDADDAKSDVILAAAVAVIGPTVITFVSRLPFVPRSGVLGALLGVAWLALLTLLVPLWLARYRGDGAAAFGLRDTAGPVAVAGAPGTTGAALLLAAPAAVAGMLALLVLGADALTVVLGRLGPAFWSADALFGLLIAGLELVVLVAGSLVLVGFLSVRSRDGFPRSPDTSLTELVRTFGLAAVGVALLTGIVRLATGASLVLLVLHLLALVAVLLLTDRLVPAGISVPRTTVVAPLVVVVLLQTFSAGGLFGGGLLLGLHRGALAAGVVIAIAALGATRRGTGATLALVIAAHWWPTCLSPLPGAGGLC